MSFWVVMMVTVMYHVIYNASYNVFAVLLVEIENRGAQKCFTAAVMLSPEYIPSALSLSISQTEHDSKVVKYATNST